MGGYKTLKKGIIEYFARNYNEPATKEKIYQIDKKIEQKEYNIAIILLLNEKSLIKNGANYLLSDEVYKCNKPKAKIIRSVNPIKSVINNVNETNTNNAKSTNTDVNDINNKLLKMLNRQKDLKNYLTDDFYLLSKIRDLYFTKNPECAENDFLNDLNTTSYKIVDEFIIRNKYKNTTEYIREYLLSQDIIDLENFKNSLPEHFIKVTSFTKMIEDLQKNYSIIEFEKDTYINIKKNK